MNSSLDLVRFELSDLLGNIITMNPCFDSEYTVLINAERYLGSNITCGSQRQIIHNELADLLACSCIVLILATFKDYYLDLILVVCDCC